MAERIGKIAEFLILWRYFCHGFRPVARRYRTPFGEIDLIMKKRDQIRFIEVKYRHSVITSDSPITRAQSLRLQRASHYAYHLLSPDQLYQAQFDIAIVSGWGRFRIIENHLL